MEKSWVTPDPWLSISQQMNLFVLYRKYKMIDTNKISSSLYLTENQIRGSKSIL